MSEGKISAKEFAYELKKEFRRKGINGSVDGTASSGIWIEVMELPKTQIPNFITEYQHREEFDHLRFHIIFHCAVEFSIRNKHRFEKIEFKKEVILNAGNYNRVEEVRIQDCLFRSKLSFKSDTGFTLNKLVFERYCIVHQLETKNIYIPQIKLRESTFHSQLSLFKRVGSSFKAVNSTFTKPPLLNFDPKPDRYFEFISCSFRNFVDLYQYNDVEDLENLSFKNCQWNFSNHTKSTIPTLLTPRGITIKPELDKLKHTFFLLRNIYSSKGVEYETRHFQRLINYVYQMQSAFTRKERRALWWAHISNDFGTDYERGIAFTLSVGLLFYLALLGILTATGRLEYDPENSLATIAHFFDLINVTKWKYDFFELGNDHIVNITVYIARIFIGYGIYQTIAAFRIITKM